MLSYIFNHVSLTHIAVENAPTAHGFLSHIASVRISGSAKILRNSSISSHHKPFSS